MARSPARLCAVRADELSARGIPGARDVDHVGLTVPDLDQAVKFFVDLLGADLL